MAIPYIGLLEAADRKARVTSTGIEIVTTFYVEPATAAPIVVCALLGGVSGNSLDTYSRRLPAHDFEYPFCYCVEAHTMPLDRRAAANDGPTTLDAKPDTATFNDIVTALGQSINFNGPLATKDPSDGTAKKGMCGAYIEAVYRPLPSIYSGSGSGSTKTDHFDYVDPQMYPCSRTFPANGVPGQQNSFVLQDVLTRMPAAVPNGSSALLVTETWQEFSIRRVMCPSVPWSTISQLENRINGKKAWTPANMTISGLPKNTFPVGTLRFDSAEPIKRTIPNCLDADNNIIVRNATLPSTVGMSWWDIVYKFSWRTTYDVWTEYGGLRGQTVRGPEYITWNCDWYMGADVGLIEGFLGGTLFPGWYEMTFEQPTNPVISWNTRRKYLDAEDSTLPINVKPPAAGGALHPFDYLFLLNAP